MRTDFPAPTRKQLDKLDGGIYFFPVSKGKIREFQTNGYTFRPQGSIHKYLE
jgi:hypothetical protein